MDRSCFGRARCRVRVLLAFPLLLHSVGCGDGPAGRLATDPQAAPMPAPVHSRALFGLHPDALCSDDWPDRYSRYGVIVAVPFLQPYQIEIVRSDVPGCTVLAYANAQDVRINEIQNAYWAALAAVFDTALCIRDLDADTVVCLDLGVPSFVMRQESAEVLAAFHRDVTMPTGWDGIYVDQVRSDYPEWKRVRLQEMVFDFDADGAPDDVAALDASYATWKPYFLARLREEVGEAAILLGNSAGPIDDPSLNGITLENVGYRFAVADAREWLLAQAVVSQAPSFSILWAVNGLSWGPSEQLAAEMRNVLVGDPAPLPAGEADRWFR